MNIAALSVINALASLLVSSAYANRIADEDNANVNWYVGHVVLGNKEMYAVISENGQFEALDAFNVSNEEYDAIESAVKAEIAKRNA